MALRPKVSILDKAIPKGKNEVSLNCFALVFSEIVQYSQSRVNTVSDLQTR